MASWAKVGVKCVCLHSGDWRDIDDKRPDTSGPQKGGIFTITDIEVGPDGDTYINLREWGKADYYWIARFRPLVSRADDVAMFKRIASEVPFHLLVDEKLGLSH